MPDRTQAPSKVSPSGPGVSHSLPLVTIGRLGGVWDTSPVGLHHLEVTSPDLLKASPRPGPPRLKTRLLRDERKLLNFKLALFPLEHV